MWCSCLRQQGQDKKHEDDKDCKTNPKSNHNGIWWKTENEMISISPALAESFLPHAAWLQISKDFRAYSWVTKERTIRFIIIFFLHRKLPLKLSFLAQILPMSRLIRNKLKDERHWILLVSKIRATPFVMPGPFPRIALETISLLEFLFSAKPSVAVEQNCYCFKLFLPQTIRFLGFDGFLWHNRFRKV